MRLVGHVARMGKGEIVKNILVKPGWTYNLEDVKVDGNAILE
jgi:hypothetical protein